MEEDDHDPGLASDALKERHTSLCFGAHIVPVELFEQESIVQLIPAAVSS